MKTLTPALAAHLAGETTTLATCWKLTRRDSSVLGFTDHDRDLTVAGVTYQASTGFTPSAIASSGALNVDNLDVEGMLDAGAITEADLLAGLYDHAQIDIFEVNYQNPADGTLPLRTGWLGEVTVQDGRFLAEVRGLTQPLAQRIGELYSPTCRASLGDARCKVAMAPRTRTGTLTGTTSRSVLRDTARTEPAGTFNFGTITFTSGANAGTKMEVKEYTPGVIVLALPLTRPVAAGDAYTLAEGCDRSFATCVSRFNNAVNFRGEPHVPGLDRMLETAGTRSEW
jgi:uncharacterized phage protein (TIGR02218 family)